MKTLSRHRFNLALFFVLFLFIPAAFAQSSLVISQVYGGGGNTGAPYTYDYVELYNPTAADISLSGYSIQYGSATGSTWNGVALPSATISAGHYFLIQGAAGTTVTGKNLPATPDFIMVTSLNQASIPNFSGTAGKIALVNNTTILSGCPTAGSGAIADLVGYGNTTGSTANCFEGTGPAATTSNTTAAIRTNPSMDSNNNSADFSVGAPNPHNSTFGSVSTILSATGAASPSTVTSGSSTLLTVTVIPATNPSSTTITVVANLAAIGGSTSQAFYDDGTNGDAVAGDDIFSYNTIASTASSGTVTLPVTVTDSQARSANASISLTVNQPVAYVPIHTIQGSKSLTSTTVSAYAGSQVETSGIVTGVGSAGFFLQAKDSDADGDPTTPEGIYAYMGTGKVPATAVIGNELQVTGVISTYPAATASHTPATEISPVSVTLLTSHNTLPTPVKITSSMLTPNGGLYQLTPYEGMRVSIDSLTTTSGTGGSLTENTETEVSNGQFYAVVTGTQRPFREPGIDIRDTLPTGAPANVARFDDNPERILVDSKFLGGSSIDLSTGAVLQNVSGIFDFTYSNDSYYDPSRLLIDQGYNTGNGNLSPGTVIQPVGAPSNTEFTVAAFNVERFFNTSSTDDIDFNPVTQATQKSSAVDVTQAAYTRRLAKASLAIRNVLGSPDIVSLEEVENQSVAADIANQISADAIAQGQTDPQYVAYGTGTTYAPYTNDVGGISIGFLVNPSRVTTLSVMQYGQNSLMPDPRNGSTQQILNDRPPLVLHAGIKRSGAIDYPVTVISNHLRSLSGIDDPSTGIFVRTKKELQAEFLANLIQGFQSSGEHVVSVGDYNVFEFSDGFTDVMSTVTGQNALSADQVVEPAVSGIVNPPATDLVTLLPPNQRWSYQEDGNAQVLDHIVATSDLVAAGAHVAYAHLNADFPLVNYNDASTPTRVSDHDPAVGYFTIPTPSLTATLSPSTSDFGAVTVNTTSPGQVFTLTNTGEGSIAITNIGIDSGFSQSNTCGASLAYGSSCNINVVFTPTVAVNSKGALTVTTSTSAFTATLTGVGLPIPESITFPNPGPQTYGVSPITLKAIATSGLPISYSVTSGPATVSGNTLTITGAGSVVVRATQAGNNEYAAATAVSVTFAVNKETETYAVVVSTPTVVAAAGGNATATLALTSTNYVGTVSFVTSITSIDGTPSSVTATASPVTLTSGGTGTSSITITTSLSSTNPRPVVPWKGGAILFCAVLLGAPITFPRKLNMAVLLIAATIIAVGFSLACGGGSSKSTAVKAARTYVVTATPTGTATPADSVTVSNPNPVNITVTVQ